MRENFIFEKRLKIYHKKITQFELIFMEKSKREVKGRKSFMKREKIT